MNSNLRTAALMAAGIVSAGTAVTAEEARMNPVETALSATTISGYVSTSAMFDLGSNDGNPMLPGRSFDGPGKINQINLDVVKLTVEKGLTEGDWSAGYKVDLLFGPDGNSLGTSSVAGFGSTSDFAVKQAYVALQTPVGNGLVAKMGVFDTLIGYEVFESGNNPNYSRSYGYYIEPTQHTGLLLSYTAADWLTLNAGIADAWNARINAAGSENGVKKEFGLQTYMASIVLTAPESMGSFKGAALYLGIVHGLTGANAAADGNPLGTLDGDPRTSLYAGLTLPLGIEGLALGLSYDYRFTHRATGPATDVNENASAAAAYLTYAISKQVKLNVRGEYATGDGGTWGSRPFGGPDEEFFALTGGVDIGLWQNALVRLEVRWDQDLASGPASFGSAISPDESALVAGVNVLYKF